MLVRTEGTTNFSVEIVKKNFEDSSFYPSLVLKRQNAEKMAQAPFEEFLDQEMLYYFIHQKKNIDEKKNRSERTKKEYIRELLSFSQDLVQFAHEIGVDIQEIKEGSLYRSLNIRHIERYQEWLRAEKPKKIGKEQYSAATIARKTVIVKSFLRFLYDSGYISIRLHTGFVSATVSKDERPNKDLGPKEVVSILEFFKEKKHPVLYGIILVLVSTGMRNEEFCTARVKDLRYDTISESFQLRITGKGNKKRTLPIKSKVYEAIIEYRKARGLTTVLTLQDESPLFPNAYGNSYSPSALSKYMKKAILRTELSFLSYRENPIGPHTFRHAFAIISHKAGVDIFTIQKSLGHESIETTQIYLQKILEAENHAIHQWDNSLLNKYINV